MLASFSYGIFACVESEAEPSDFRPAVCLFPGQQIPSRVLLERLFHPSSETCREQIESLLLKVYIASIHSSVAGNTARIEIVC